MFKTLNKNALLNNIGLYASVCGWVLLRSYMHCVVTLACAALAFGVACIAAAMARVETAAVCFYTAWAVSFVILLFKQPTFKTEDNNNEPWLTWFSFAIGNCAAAWVIMYYLQWPINLAKTWNLF